MDELLAKTGPGCSILLKRSPDDTDYIFHERLTAEGRGEALIAETPLGNRTDYEITEIPSATPEVQLPDEPAATLLAVSESGC